MEDEVLSGVVNYFKPGLVKKWAKKWAVLYKQSSHGIARLELYDSKDHFDRRDKTPRKHVHIISLEKCSNYVEDHINDGKKTEFVIKLNFTDEKQHQLSLERHEELKTWCHAISSVVFGGDLYSDATFNDDLFEVEIEKNDVTEKLNLSGFYLLSVSFEDIELLDINTKKSIIKWPLHLLRKYGRDKQEFSLEAGRRCPSGPGMFYFKTDQYNAIFQEVENNVKSLATRNRTASTSSNTSLAKSGFSNCKLAPESVRPASPRVLPPPSSVYDDPIDVRKESKSAQHSDDYTYNEPINLAPPPNSKNRPLPAGGNKSSTPNPTKEQGKKKSKGFGAVFKAPNNVGPAKPPRKTPAPKTTGPDTINEVTYAEPLGNEDERREGGDLSSEYSHLDISGNTNRIDTEYDSISYPNHQWKPSTAQKEENAYATTGDFSGGYEAAPPDSVYDHVKR